MKTRGASLVVVSASGTAHVMRNGRTLCGRLVRAAARVGVHLCTLCRERAPRASA